MDNFTAKFVYSKPITKVLQSVYVDANGNLINISNNTNAKRISLPRYTVCSLYLRETNELAFGIARCSSNDVFIKKIGRDLSYQRALKNPCCKVSIPVGIKISDMTVAIANQLIRNKMLND